MSEESKVAVGIAVTAQAWEAIAGAYDLRTHVAPDLIERRIDDLDLAREFLAHGLKGFVLKSHYIPMAERASVVTKAMPGIEAYGKPEHLAALIAFLASDDVELITGQMALCDGGGYLH
jgi:NAD(P)-dependent dehydrogenase (short-subunit alcohol dehydrogenase family)